MTEERKDTGRDLCHQRLSRIMQDIRISVERPKQHNVTIDNIPAFNRAPNRLGKVLGKVLGKILVDDGPATAPNIK